MGVETVQAAERGEAGGGDCDQDGPADRAEAADGEPQVHGRAADGPEAAVQRPGGPGTEALAPRQLPTPHSSSFFMRSGWDLRLRILMFLLVIVLCFSVFHSFFNGDKKERKKKA